MKIFTALILAFASSDAHLVQKHSPLLPRQAVTVNNTATVDLSVTRGRPQHLASGFIYGIPDKPNQIPDHWYTDIDFGYGRAGGAQLDAPARGWIYGLTEYGNRLASALSNYYTCRKYGASYVLLPHDIWGTDHANASTVWPGDNGDWTDYDLYIQTLATDLKNAGALDALVFDIWNEPDMGIFWPRPLQQWVDLYIRTHKILRSIKFMDKVLVSGPTLSFRPLSDNPWWTIWLAQISGNNTIPDQYAYHLEGDTDAVDNDIETTNATLGALLQQYGLPERQININEYANPYEQIPAGAAWWISRLERYDAIGLRGNWLSGTTLHDLFANLLTKYAEAFNYTATDYAPAGEYQVYKYYNLNMTGTRLNTSGSGDRQLDTYATYDHKKVKVLVGARFVSGLWYVTLENLSAYGLPAAGNLTIQTWGFPGATVWTIVQAPTNLGLYTHAYDGDSLTFPIFQNDPTTAYAFEFDTVR